MISDFYFSLIILNYEVFLSAPEMLFMIRVLRKLSRKHRVNPDLFPLDEALSAR